MKVVTIWQNSGVITLLRDSNGDLYTPKEKIPVPDSFDLHIPICEEVDLRNVQLPEGVLCFIDPHEDKTQDSAKKLRQLLKCKEETNLLIVTASDSVERKTKLVEVALPFMRMIRILEVSLPISCLGPTLTKEGLLYSDIEARRRTNFLRQDVYEICTTAPHLTSLGNLIPHVLKQYIEHREIWFPEKTDGSCYITSEHEFTSGAFYHSQLIPFKLTGLQDLPTAPHAYSDIASQNPRHGIVKKLRRITNHESLPPSLVTVQSDAADLRFGTPWANNTVCQGSTFDDIQNAELSALGEAYERYCVNIISLNEIFTGSADALQNEGLSAVNPTDFVLFTDEQISAFEGKFERFDNDTVTTWIKGQNFHGEQRLVPVSMVFVNHRRLKKFGEYPLPSINAPAYAGVSAGKTITSACINALQEIMERHATMCWWHNPPNNPGLSLPRSGPVADLIAEFENKGNRVSIVGIENRFQIPIYAATVLNLDSGIVNTGFGCRPTNQAAIFKALTEACTLQAGSFDLLNPRGELFKAIERGELWEGIVKPWRADRRYLDYYSPDFSIMNDLMLQQQVYLDQRLLPRVQSWLFPTAKRNTLYPDTHFKSDIDELNHYLSLLEDMHLEPIMVDITSPDVRSVRISVVRVIVPGLVPNFAIGDLHLGKGAIQREPVLLGHALTPTGVEQINRNPLPHC